MLSAYGVSASWAGSNCGFRNELFAEIEYQFSYQDLIKDNYQIESSVVTCIFKK